MYYIKLTALSAFLFGITAVSAQNPSSSLLPLTIHQIWQQAEQNSKAVQIQQIKLQSSEEEIKDARKERLPDINAAGQYARVSNMPQYEDGIFHTPTQYPLLHTYYTLGADAYLNVYSGNKTNLNIAERETRHQITEEQSLQVLSDVRLRAAAYYLEIQRGLIFKDLTQKNIAEQQQQLEHIRQLQKNGVVLKSDLLRAELQLSRQQLSLDQIDNDIAIARQKLNILIGQPDSTPILPTQVPDPDSLAPAPLQDYLDLAEAQSHAGRISQQEIALRKLRVKEARAANSPHIGLFAMYTYAYPQILFYPYAAAVYGWGMAGVKASFSFSGLYQNKHKIKIAELEAQAQDVEHKSIDDAIREQVTSSWLRYKEALHRIEVAQKNVAQARENARIVSNTYFNQLSLVTDLLDANTQSLQTRFELAAAQMAALLQYYQLLNSIGNL